MSKHTPGPKGYNILDMPPDDGTAFKLCADDHSVDVRVWTTDKALASRLIQRFAAASEMLEMLKENMWGTESLCIECSHWYDEHRDDCALAALRRRIEDD